MGELASVAQCWRYPVKSMQGEVVPEVRLGMLGVEQDRLWATRDQVRGGIRGAKQLGGLMSFAARLEPDGRTLVTLPDGRTVHADDASASEVISDALGHPVTLEPLAPADDLDHYRRGAPDSDDPLEGLRQIFALEADDPFPDFSKFPPSVVEFESPPGTYYDCWPLVLITDASIRHLQSLAPDSVIDIRRFRPSLYLHTEADGFAEQAWVGERLRVGTALVEVLSGCPRCVMTTRGFAELPEDRSIMRTLVREAGQDLGVYARVLEPGTVRAGDPVVAVS
jgi:uncharacterized protein